MPVEMPVSDAARFDLAMLRVRMRNQREGRVMTFRELLQAAQDEVAAEELRLKAEVAAIREAEGISALRRKSSDS